MIVTHKLVMNLEKKERTPWIEVPQWDAYSRQIKLMLFEGKKPWAIPEGAAVVIHYRRSDGTEGAYDTLPNGECAWTAEDHTLTLTLAPQMLTAAGSVMLHAALLLEEKVLHTFAVEISVLPGVEQGTQASSENYFQVTGVLSAPEKAQIGQFLRVLDVNEAGKILSLEAADMPEAGVDEAAVLEIVEDFAQDHIAQPDWDQTDESQPDFVKNRPFGLGSPTILVAQQTVELPDSACELLEYDLKADTYYKLTLDGVIYEDYARTVDFFGTAFVGFGNVEGVFDDTLDIGEFALFSSEGITNLIVPGAEQCEVKLEERAVEKLDRRFVDLDRKKVTLTILDDDPYLYLDQGETKITYDQLLEIATGDYSITVEHPFGTYTLQYPALIRFDDEGYASIWTVVPVGGLPEFQQHYTAEYTQS